MIIEKRKYYTWYTFADPRSVSFKWNNIFLQCPERFKHIFYWEKQFSTLQINLKQNYYSNFQADLQYEIRRASKDNLIIDFSHDTHPVVSLFQQTIKAKSLNTLNNLHGSKDRYIVSVIKNDLYTLCAHYYLLDKSNKMVLLKYNASGYREMPSANLRSLCGRANRLLFYRDFQYFEQQGYDIFDFGGFNPLNKNEDIRGVHSFKKEFGAKLVHQFNYYPYSYTLPAKFLGRK